MEIDPWLVDLPIKIGDFHSYVELPECKQQLWIFYSAYRDQPAGEYPKGIHKLFCWLSMLGHESNMWCV